MSKEFPRYLKTKDGGLLKLDVYTVKIGLPLRIAALWAAYESGWW